MERTVAYTPIRPLWMFVAGSVLLVSVICYWFFQPQLRSEQKCAAYNSYRVQARNSTDEELNQVIAKKIAPRETNSQNDWIKYAAYFHVYEEKNGLHDQDEWGVCD